MFKAALLQVTCGPDIAANTKIAVDLTREAVKAGANFVFMPENIAFMGWGRDNIIKASYPGDTHPTLQAFKALAAELKVWLHAGSMIINVGGEDVVNRTHVINPEGAVVAYYDKIHMFDVDLVGGESYRESATFRAGSKAVVVKTPYGGLGLSICYDLRFPYLFRALAQNGADFITSPAAFTQKTGEAHWHVLMRARAIETGCYVISPAQSGTHAHGRQTFGHSLVVSPWGEIIGDAGTNSPSFILVDIDPLKVAEARNMIPFLKHDRTFTLEVQEQASSILNLLRHRNS